MTLKSNAGIKDFMVTENVDVKDLITLTEAKKILGYASTKSVNDLINKGSLDAWKFAHKTAHMVSMVQVLNLTKPIQIKKRKVENEQ